MLSSSAVQGGTTSRGCRAQKAVLTGPSVEYSLIKRETARTIAAPSAAPCIARKKSIETSFWAKPHAIDQMTNQIMPPMNTLREERARGSGRDDELRGRVDLTSCDHTVRVVVSSQPLITEGVRSSELQDAQYPLTARTAEAILRTRPSTRRSATGGSSSGYSGPRRESEGRAGRTGLA